MNLNVTYNTMKFFLVFVLAMCAFDAGYSIQKVPREKFLEDCSILKKSLDELHPGIYRYSDESYFENAYDDLINIAGDSISEENAFLMISEFLAKIRCGHTIVNPYNQNENISNSILKGKNKLPFTFTIVDKRMIIQQDVSDEELDRGSEVFEINGTPVEKIIEDLMKYSDGDGSNDAQRVRNMGITGLGDYEFFDIYFPLIVPPVEGAFEITYNSRKSRAGFLSSRFFAITREERKLRLEQKHNVKDVSYDEQWKFKILDNRTGLLQIGTFVTYNMKLDWKKFLADAFAEMNKKNIPNLIIDIRGNAGGTTEVAGEIVSYLTQEPIDVMMEKRLVRYVKIPDDLAPYLSTWDNSFKDRTGTVEKYDDTFYVLKDESENENVIIPKENPYPGKTYLLVDAANSSATFILAKTLKKNGLATLVGQTTGGNQKGINGGQLMFLDLPNTGIEVDIPLIGYFPAGNPPDAGLEPDVKISKSAKDFADGIDAEMNYVLEQTRRGGSGD
jgi:hypothetical protein